MNYKIRKNTTERILRQFDFPFVQLTVHHVPCGIHCVKQRNFKCEMWASASPSALLANQNEHEQTARHSHYRCYIRTGRA